jgi:hypothetical protein
MEEDALAEEKGEHRKRNNDRDYDASSSDSWHDVIERPNVAPEARGGERKSASATPDPGGSGCFSRISG